MKNFILGTILTLTFSLQSFASCLPVIERKTKAKEERLLFAKKKEKKAAMITGSAVGGVNAVFWGIMFKLITDGATIPTSILVGGSFGVMTGGATVAIVGVPMITYNQIIKAQIKKYKKTSLLIVAANEYDKENKLLKKMYRKVKRKLPKLIMDQMISEINIANDKMVFCSNNRIYGFNKIKRYLRKQSIDENLDNIVVKTEDGDVLNLEIDSSDQKE